MRTVTYRLERFVRFTLLRPGAPGLPLRGELSFDAFTNSSNSVFGTAMSFRIASLYCWNSGVESNEAGFMLPPFYRSVVVKWKALPAKEI